MLPHSITQAKQRLDDKVSYLDKVLSLVYRHPASSTNDIAKMQNIAANYLAVAASGLVETGIQTILYEFTTKRCSPQVRRYVQDRLGWAATLNCKKIDTLLGRFDTTWRDEFCTQRTDKQKKAIDSLKTLRDQVAHGKQNGTGYVRVKDYYKEATDALETLAGIVNS